MSDSVHLPPTVSREVATKGAPKVPPSAPIAATTVPQAPRPRPARGGRPRKDGARLPCGRLRPQGEAPPEALRHRAALVGEARAANAEAGSALGLLLHAGLIARRQYEAGQIFAADWRRWASFAGIRPHVLVQPGQRRPDDPSPEAWLKARDRHMAAVRLLRAQTHGRLVFAALECFAIDDELPEAWRDGRMPAAALAALRRGLTALAGHYGLPVAVSGN